MNVRLTRCLALALTSLCSLAHAESKAKRATPEKPQLPELTQFEGCGKKDKAGKWVEFYVNCQGFNGSAFSPAPPCKEGFVKVNEAVPSQQVSHLEQCMYEL